MSAEFSGQSVLLVEDHADNAQIFARMLTRAGYEVRIAGRVSEALAAARERRWDVLLCDLTLPDGDGCDLLREIESIYPVHAIAVTGHGCSSDLDRCRSAGFAKHLLKPVAMDDLLAAIRLGGELRGVSSAALQAGEQSPAE